VDEVVGAGAHHRVGFGERGEHGTRGLDVDRSLAAELGLPAAVVQHRPASPSTSAARMSSVEAIDPLRHTAGATDAACASASRWLASSTGRHRATVNGPSSTTTGVTRCAETNCAANRVSDANQAIDGDSSPPTGVSDSHTDAPNASRRTDGTERRPPDGSSSSMRLSSPYDTGESCQPPSPLHRLRPKPL
jgi:hypothetical protein